MNDVVYSLVVKKRSFETEQNEKNTFLFWLEITKSDDQCQCFVPVSDDFFSLEELVIRLQMAFPKCVLEASTSIQYEHETCMIVKGIKQNVLKDCSENCKNLI